MIFQCGVCRKCEMLNGGIMNKTGKRILLIAGAIVLIVILCFVLSNTSKNENYAEKYEGTDLSEEVEGLNREGTYSEYLKQYAAKHSM